MQRSPERTLPVLLWSKFCKFGKEPHRAQRGLGAPPDRWAPDLSIESACYKQSFLTRHL
jgi:hypothetical protein